VTSAAPSRTPRTAARLDTLAFAVEELRSGRPVVVLDDADRENEGDLVMAAEFATAETMGFFVRWTSGLICVPMAPEIADRLELPLMVAPASGGNGLDGLDGSAGFSSSGGAGGSGSFGSPGSPGSSEDSNGAVDSVDSVHSVDSVDSDIETTAYTVSVDAVGVGSGISAADRARTARALADRTTRPDQLIRPGHVFPLRARAGGIAERRGHTEATVDLLRLAGLTPVGVISEVCEDDGSIARFDRLRAFADEHRLALVSIDQLPNRLRLADATTA
jgi:3,4-dihydroxy 2-butanone 4-phosphate synthase / GTP cyclohydrolase II